MEAEAPTELKPSLNFALKVPYSRCNFKDVPNGCQNIWAKNLGKLITNKGNKQTMILENWRNVDQNGVDFPRLFLFLFDCLDFKQ